MRYHVVSLPHTQVTKEWSNCAFTQNVRNFVRILKMNGHEVVLYASEDCDVEVDELVTCITKKEQADLCNVTGPDTVLNAAYQHDKPHWVLFNQRAQEALRTRAQAGDILGIIAGDLNQPLVDEFQWMLPTEFAIGYSGISHNAFHVFASYAWMHLCYGHWYGAHGTKGRFYTRVIPHYLDPDEFQYREDKDDYFVFIGRVNEDKGVAVAAQVCNEIGAKLVVAGQGSDIPSGVDYRGRAGPEERAELFAGAKAAFVPSLYLEAFGMVAIEALVSGTPVISTDWGGLSEIVIPEVGFKCHTFDQFVKAAQNIEQIDPAACRARGLTYSLENTAPIYESYFKDLQDIREPRGWYTRHKD